MLVFVPVPQSEAAACNDAQNRFARAYQEAQVASAAFRSASDPGSRADAWERSAAALAEMGAALDLVQMTLNVIMARLNDDAIAAEVRKMMTKLSEQMAIARKLHEDIVAIFGSPKGDA